MKDVSRNFRYPHFVLVTEGPGAYIKTQFLEEVSKPFAKQKEDLYVGH